MRSDAWCRFGEEKNRISNSLKIVVASMSSQSLHLSLVSEDTVTESTSSNACTKLYCSFRRCVLSCLNHRLGYSSLERRLFVYSLLVLTYSYFPSIADLSKLSLLLSSCCYRTTLTCVWPHDIICPVGLH
jgi:hypothetical protein